MTATRSIDFGPVVHVRGGNASAQILVICEHASKRIPADLDGLGLDAEAQQSHVAWDPGALGVANAMADAMQAPLVAGAVSRLVYDCNRPPEAGSAIPPQSEAFAIPGNRDLTLEDKQARVEGVYLPFHDMVARQVDRAGSVLKLIVTVHSFTPIFHGRPREVELGLLHGRDDRFAKAMLAATPPGIGMVTRLNEPYSAADGVAHMLDKHGTANGVLNVMIEIRNDLIADAASQRDIADRMTPWIKQVLSDLISSEAA